MSGYGTDDGFASWLSGQGLTLPVGAATPAVLRQIGSDYIDAAYEHALSCSRRASGFEHDRAWPRTGHRIRGQLVPDTLVPPQWVNASYRAAYLEATNPGWAIATRDPNRVTKREKVDGAVEREFFGFSDGVTTNASGMVVDATINGMVLPLLCSSARTADSLFRVI